MNEIRTLNIDEACQLLHTHKSTLYQKIASRPLNARSQADPFQRYSPTPRTHIRTPA